MKSVSDYPRIHTKSLRVAVSTKKLLEQRLGVKVDVAVSSKHVIFLDHDNPNYNIEKLNAFITFVEAIAKEFQSDYAVYLTPHGAHGVVFVYLDFKDWKSFYVSLLDALDQRAKLKYIVDVMHVYMSIKRGYTTLRLNQICKYIEGHYKVDKFEYEVNKDCLVKASERKRL